VIELATPESVLQGLVRRYLERAPASPPLLEGAA
jgi:hypothetical protein